MHTDINMCLASGAYLPVPAHPTSGCLPKWTELSSSCALPLLSPGPSAAGDWPSALSMSPCTCCHDRPPTSGAYLLMPAPDFNVEARCPSARPSSDSSGSAPSMRSTLSPGWATSWAPSHQPQEHQLSHAHTRPEAAGLSIGTKTDPKTTACELDVYHLVFHVS